MSASTGETRALAAKAREAKAAADETRANWLDAVTDGRATVQHLIEAAVQPAGKPLRQLTLKKVLAAQDEWSDGDAQRVADQTVNRYLELSPTANRPKGVPKVRWLIHEQSRHNRLVAFSAALYDRSQGPPTPRFPFDA